MTTASAAELEYTKDLPGYERGHPHYFRDPVIDHLLEVVLLLGGELWVNRDRQMIMEELLAKEGKVTPEMIDTMAEAPIVFASASASPARPRCSLWRQVMHRITAARWSLGIDLRG